MGKIIVGKTGDFAPGKLQKVAVDGKDLLITNIGGQYHAVSDTCTHAGASLSEGKLEGEVVTCGWHGAKFDCKSGKLVEFPVKVKDLASYKVIVESDNVFVEI